ncbi:hypothetical protein [Paractinoplanes brasiliensis]|uniref:PH (Pleckstrin Homology) domain-containing protein n=1 Tax=Paractinoplanes brasiliensis TaxID=52695 RepID=A0A4R6J6P8_9ACTN|nr:hypothetical protein [Actinoplanes brasiliensis]TDO31154.1 hypothetical protein C8E87_6564 [Actinoplanes brasiliensis]GID28532.1 hypothetical protein Abr02nite_35150 [Actinoplanes brasiliensis]
MSVLRRAAAAEAATWRNLALWVSRRPVELHGGQAYGYLGVVKPILGVFLVLSVVEIPILDLIVKHVVPWGPARLIMLAISVWGLLWMLGFLGGMIRHPHLVVDEGLRVRMGPGIDLTVPWADVESIGKRYRSMPSSRAAQFEDGALHIVVGSQTSIDVRLRRPLAFDVPRGPSEPVSELRLYADDADGLVRAARTHLDAVAA